MVDSVKKKQTAKRASIARKTHAVKDKERAEKIVDIKALYIKEKNNPVVQDILAHAKKLAAMHTKVAQDGVGARKTGEKYENGMDVVENIYLTNNKRVSELDRSAGLLELSDYVERMFTPASETTLKKAQGK